MADYRQPVKNEVEKNTQVDFNEGWTLVRTITAVQALFPWTPGMLSANRLADCFKANCRVLALRCFSNVAASAPRLAIIAESIPGPALSTDKTYVPASQLELAFHGTLTFSGATCVNRNPITGVVDANTWNACSLLAAIAGHPTPSVVEIPTAACPLYEKTFTIDCLGRNLFYPLFTTLDTATSLIVAMKRLE